jgi:hypothetical protein
MALDGDHELHNVLVSYARNGVQRDHRVQNGRHHVLGQRVVPIKG